MPTMYIPSAYQNDTPLKIIADNPLAQLTSVFEGEIYATAAPILIDEERSSQDNLVLIGHMAKHNEHASKLENGMPTLSVFSGPNAYISPNWYEERKTVPTWNYLAAQVRGKITPFDDTENHLDILVKTITQMEAFSDKPWTLEQSPKGKVESLLPNIISFEIAVESIEAVSKLSQTHPKGDRLRVAYGLSQRGLFGDKEVSALMHQGEEKDT